MRLATADGIDKRLGVLESQLAAAKGNVNLAELLFSRGRVSELDVLRSKALALRIEVMKLKQRTSEAERPAEGPELWRLHSELVETLDRAVAVSAEYFKHGATDFTGRLLDETRSQTSGERLA